METKIQQLHKLIRPIPIDYLEEINVPTEERTIFANYVVIPIELLVEAVWNYKEDNEFTSEKLRNNIKRNGQIENIHIRLLETGYYEVINGNHRLRDSVELGKQFMIAYNHGQISLQEAQRIAIETNETRFETNIEKLSGLLKALSESFDSQDLSATLPFNEETLAQLLSSSPEDLHSIQTADVNEDDYNEPPPAQAKTHVGDLYELNSHKLLCGDSTSALDVDKLMNGELAHMLHTDPPYNVKYAELSLSRCDSAKDWSEQYCTEWNDDMTDEDYSRFLFDFVRNAKQHLIEHAHYYIWHSTTYYGELLKALVANDIPYDKVPILWVKQVAPLSWMRYKRKHEPCVYAGKGASNGNGEGARWFGPNNETTIWEIDREHNINYIHPTQKPLALCARAIRNSSQTGEIVLDLFGGSGSTLIAAEQLDRSARLMELSPGFCDAIVKRYVKFCLDNNKTCTIKLNGEVINGEEF